MRTGSPLKRRTAIGAAILSSLTLTTTASPTPTQSTDSTLHHDTHATPAPAEPQQATDRNPSLERDFIMELITRHVVALQSGQSLEEVMADDQNRSGLLFQETHGFDGVDLLTALLQNPPYGSSLQHPSDALIRFSVKVACSAHARTLAAAQAVVIPDGPRAPRFLAPPRGHPFVVRPESVKDETVRAGYEVKYRAAQHAERQWQRKMHLDNRVNLLVSMGESQIQLIRRIMNDRADQVIAEALAQASRDADLDYFEIYQLTPLRDLLSPQPDAPDQ